MALEREDAGKEELLKHKMILFFSVQMTLEFEVQEVFEQWLSLTPSHGLCSWLQF